MIALIGLRQTLVCLHTAPACFRTDSSEINALTDSKQPFLKGMSWLLPGPNAVWLGPAVGRTDQLFVVHTLTRLALVLTKILDVRWPPSPDSYQYLTRNKDCL